MTFRTNALKVQAFAGALFGVQVGTTTMAQVNADITSNGGLANTLNGYYASSFGNVANATVAASVAANLGLTGDALASGTAYITAQLNGAAAGARGAVISNILDLFAGLASDATFGAAATAWNAKVDAANAYTGAANVAIGSTVSQGTAFTLTAGVDTPAGTAGNDTFNATAATFSASDVLIGGAGTDTLNIVNSGATPFSTPSASVTGIEQVSIKNVNTAAVAAVSAVAQQVTVTAKFAAANTNKIVVNYGTQTQEVTLTGITNAAGAATNAGIITAAINGMAGATIAVATAADILITAPVAGTPLPSISFSSATATADYPTVAATRANVVGVNAVAATDTIAAGTFVGATAFTNDVSTNQVDFTGLTSGQSVTIKGNGASVNGSTEATWGATVTAPVLNITGGTTGTTGNVKLTSNGATSVTINSSGAPLTTTGLTGTNTIGTLTTTGTTTSTLNINADSNLTATTSVNTAAKTINVSGAATLVTIPALTASNLTTIDASAMTVGGVSVALLDGITSFKGGQGNDTVTTAAGLSADAVIDAGAGTADVLVTRAASDIDTAIEAAKYRNFETLRVIDSQDVSLVSGITRLQLNAMTSKTVSNISAVQASSITVRADQTTALTLSLKDATGSNDSVTLNLTSGAASNASTTNVDVAGLSIIGVETLNIAATTGAATTTGASDVAFASGGADRLSAINLSGSADITLVGTNITRAVTVNNTGTGVFTTSGNYATKSVINGSATGVNAFTVGTSEGVTYVGGSNKDTFAMSEALLLADGTTDTVLSGGAGVDTLSFSNTTAALTDTHFTNVTGMEVLTLTATSGGSLTTGGSFKTAFADGVTITGGTVANGSAIAYNMGLYDKATTLTIVSAGDGASTADNVTVVTGAGNDNVTVTAADWVGGASNGTISINTGAGSDTITFTVKTLADATDANPVVITGGTGKDYVFATSVNGDGAAGKTAYVTYNIAAGDSNVDSYDEITGFDRATADLASDVLNLSGTPTINSYAATAASGFSAAELTVAVASSTGLVTFAGTSAASLGLAAKIAAVQSVVTTTSGDTVLFTDGADAYVFQNVTSGDILVRLVGQASAVSLTTTLTDDIVNTIAIA